jgi:hypothetical protein
MLRAGSGLVLSLVFLASAAAADHKENPQEWQPIRITGQQKMPEFADIAGWINSPPLQAADLKGKVVVVHFLAFG